MPVKVFETNPNDRLDDTLYEQFGHTRASFLKGVKVIQQWAATQPHFPEIPSQNVIECFYFINKCSIEVTKQKIDMYYTIRALIPEVYENKHPSLPHMQAVADTIYVIPLPKLTKEGNRVTITKYNTLSAQQNPYDYFAHCLNLIEVRFQEEVSNSNVLIYDLQNFSLAHLRKFTPMVSKHFSLIMEKVFSNRIHQMHFLNCPFLEPLLKIVKAFLNPKLKKRIHVHKKVECLYDYIPRELLPKEYGGQEKSLAELNELWKLKFEEYKDRFDKLYSMKVVLKLRPNHLKNDDTLGFHGNFKQLDVD